MKNITRFLAIVVLLLATGCTKEFLDKKPLDKFTDDTYWTNEPNLRAYAQEIYLPLFEGYSTDFVNFGGFFTGDSWSNDFSRTSPTAFPRIVDEATNSAAWSFATVRKANVMLEKIPTMKISEDAKKHWIGIARFFRAMAYSALVKNFGDVPYYDKVPASTDLAYLYKGRDAQLEVVDKVMEDYRFAVDNIQASDGRQQINKYVAGAYMSRWMLYHATWFKYHGSTIGQKSQQVPNEKLKSYFDAAIYGAQEVMASENYSIGDTYNELFSSDNLEGNKEVIFYREYASGLVTNALMSYNAKEEQIAGLCKNALDDYLCADGLPISQSSLYQGTINPEIAGEFANRDPRLYQSFVDSLRLPGLNANNSPTGYVCKKYLNEAWLATGSDYVNNNRSPADCPLIRYAEVLLNYVEARYEVSKVGGDPFTQNDLDATINKIRGRKLVKWGETLGKTMPRLQLAGGSLAADGTVIADSRRDPSIDPILWEIRRERRIELMMEGHRGNDLRRWAKFEYLNTGTATTPTDINKGAWIVKSKYNPSLFEGATPKLRLWYPTADQSAGYLWPCSVEKLQRTFTAGDPTSERVYLHTVTVEQINLYKGKGYTLYQTQGWE